VVSGVCLVAPFAPGERGFFLSKPHFTIVFVVYFYYVDCSVLSFSMEAEHPMIYYVKLSENLTVKQTARTPKEAVSKALVENYYECSPYILVTERPMKNDLPDDDATVFSLEHFDEPSCPTFIGFEEAFISLRIAE
jgi:hypothetical protein